MKIQGFICNIKKQWRKVLLLTVPLFCAIAVLYFISKDPDTQEAHRASFTNGVLCVDSVRYEMVRVEAGTFIMGDPFSIDKEDIARGKAMSQQVTLTEDYYIGKTEVTQALWKAVMGFKYFRFEGDNRPAETVNRYDINIFISRLNALTGCRFRLPTEAEWEYAARGGNKSRHYKFSGSDDVDEVAWTDENSGGKTHDVASKRPNELGIFDMSGNVREFCSDDYYDYSREPVINPTCKKRSEVHIARGGDYWMGVPNTTYRSTIWFDGHHGDIGLRLCVSAR